jgi:hypothetical protein
MVNKKAKWHLKHITRMVHFWDIQQKKRIILKPFHQVFALLFVALITGIIWLPDTIPSMIKWVAMLLCAPALWYGYRSNIKRRFKGLTIHSSCQDILNWHFTNYPIHNEQARKNLQELQNYLTSIKSERCFDEDAISEYKDHLDNFIFLEKTNLGVRQPKKRSIQRIAVIEQNTFEFLDRDLSTKSPASSDCQ